MCTECANFSKLGIAGYILIHEALNLILLLFLMQ